MSRPFAFCLAWLSLAVPAAAQVEVQARLEKTRYLAGEPILVFVDVRNVGDEPVADATCEGDVRLNVVGVARRVFPNIFGCYTGIGSGSGVGCGVGHAPHLRPGETKSSTYLLKEYDLVPDRYELIVTGKRWNSPVWTPGKPAPPTPQDISEAHFEQKLSFEVVPSTEDELGRAFAPMVAAADAADPERRFYARSAIIDSAPRFLESLIARFAAEDAYRYSAVDALGRMRTVESVRTLQQLFAAGSAADRAHIVLALARTGHADNVDFFARVLQNPELDEMTRGYAALGIGHIGGDAVVPLLDAGVIDAPPQVRSWIATALGNTGARAAVPALIRMWGNDAVSNAVCGALKTLTHRAWCGTADEPAAKRRQWMRWWTENGSTTPIYGIDDCPEDPVVPAEALREPADIARARVSRVPIVSSIVPRSAVPNSYVHISGSGLGMEDSRKVRVVFARGDEEHVAQIGGGGRALSSAPDGGIQYMDVVVPERVTPGRWQVSVHAHGRRSTPVDVEVIAPGDVILTGVSPQQAFRGQSIEIGTRSPAPIGVQVEVTDARGARRRIGTGVSPHGVRFTLPEEVADGEAFPRVAATRDGVERLSDPVPFSITSDPLPLVIAFLTPAAAGQWTDIAVVDELALRRADRIELEFRQGDVSVIQQTTGPDNVHVQIPAALVPGHVTVRTRTWIENTVSEWSRPFAFRASDRPAPPSVTSIEAGPIRSLVWWSGDAAPALAEIKPGEALVLRGHFPVARAADLRIQLRGRRATFDLAASDVSGGVRVETPTDIVPGDWRLLIGAISVSAALQEVTTIRVK